MNNKLKNIVVTITFLSAIIIILIANIAKNDTIISIAERRKLQQFPDISISKLIDGSFFEKFEKYTMDQFIERESFRKLKTNVEINILKKQDSNKIYKYEEKLIEQIYPLNEKSVLNITNKINEIKDRYINGSNKVYYTIVPDKNYFINKGNLKLDYKKMENIINEELKWAKYIDIFNCLDLSSYYSTDSHWKQEKLHKVVDNIANKMNLKIEEKYQENKITDFKGVYAGQFPINTQSDELKILTNETIENCKVYNYETNKTTKLYDIEKLKALDKYDIYLSGATPLLTIENPKNDINEELIVFRDSYGSSLIPLLVSTYKKITVIDTRYISPKILSEYVQFEGKDILFIYSTMLINNSISLK